MAAGCNVCPEQVSALKTGQWMRSWLQFLAIGNQVLHFFLNDSVLDAIDFHFYSAELHWDSVRSCLLNWWRHDHFAQISHGTEVIAAYKKLANFYLDFFIQVVHHFFKNNTYYTYDEYASIDIKMKLRSQFKIAFCAFTFVNEISFTYNFLVKIQLLLLKPVPNVTAFKINIT